jgi:uncharacterized protein YecT (DUF1311 family)
MIAVLAVLLAALPSNALPNCKSVMDDGGPQQEMNFCAGKAWQESDAEMNRAWSRLKGIMRTKDAEGGSPCYPAKPNSAPKCLGYEEALIKAQRAWLSFRDAECVIGGYAERGSGMEAMLVSQCREDLTRKRTKELTDTIDGFTGGHWH